jgi:tetratricopeptide (TPR) repeat protein
MRWRVGLLAGAIIALAIAIGGSATGDSAAALFVQRGDAYRDGYLYSLAADQYRQALDRQPNNPIALLRLCDVSLRRGLPDEAEAYAERAGRAGADPMETARCRARVAESHGRGERAAEQWAIVVAARPNDREAHIRLIEAQLAAHDWRAALAAADAMLKAWPGDATAAFYLGALLSLDDPVRARGYLNDTQAETTALAHALDDPLSLANRSYRAVAIGRVFLEHDRLPLAWRALVAATAERPDYPDAFAYLGITYDQLGDAALAAAYLDRALELDPNSIVGLYLRGVYLSRHARWVEARADLERVAQIDPENAPVAFALGRALAEQAEYTAAEQQFARALAREPDNPDWHLALAELYIGRLIRVADLGVPAARRAVDLAPASAAAHDWLGWGLHLVGDDAQAEAELRAAIDLDPALARARLHLGNLLIDAGRIEHGRTELLRAAELDPQGQVGARARQLLGQP